MRSLILTLLALVALSAIAAEPPAQPYPLWDGKESAANYAKRAGLEPTKTLDLGNGVKLELVLIPAGKFIMGTPKPEPVDEKGYSVQALVEARREYEAAKARFEVSSDTVESSCDREKPAHGVTLTKLYYLGKFEVMQEQYQQIMGNNPSHLKGRDLPVEQVSWEDAQEFCRKVSERVGATVRLPREAEWEHACRAGTRTTYYTGDAEADLDQAAWYGKNSKKTTHPVGQKTSNAWGVYDMHGNIWEWCADWFETYKADAVVDPRGPANGDDRVMRGGSWGAEPVNCRSADRSYYSPDHRDRNIGFRVVVEASMKVPDQRPAPPSNPKSPPPPPVRAGG